MPGIMDTFDQLQLQHQVVAKAMADAARQTMVDHGLQPLNDDHAARFDEACAKYLNARLAADARRTEGCM
jgi:hypothetical protein